VLFYLFVFFNLLKLFGAVHPANAGCLKPLSYFFFFFFWLFHDTFSHWLGINYSLKSVDTFETNEFFVHASHQNLAIHRDLNDSSYPFTINGVERFYFFAQLGTKVSEERFEDLLLNDDCWTSYHYSFIDI
jgi:hypothetical protein